VYAQMTLQPLNPVSHRGRAIFISLARWLSGRHGRRSSYGCVSVCCCAARAERRLPARGDGHHEQAADQLLLQDADGQRHQHARRLLRAPPFRGARPPASGVVECVCNFVLPLHGLSLLLLPVTGGIVWSVGFHTAAPSTGTYCARHS
jgi:hypothetical protein